MKVKWDRAQGRPAGALNTGCCVSAHIWLTPRVGQGRRHQEWRGRRHFAATQGDSPGVLSTPILILGPL